MTTRTILAASAAFLAATMTATALAASTARAPKDMVLQPSDFPRSAAAQAIKPTKPDAISHVVIYRYRTSSKKRAELTSSVTVMPNVKLARFLYREQRSGLILEIENKLTLPRYGDEQVAAYLPATDGQLVVRKGKTVWVLAIGAVTGAPHLTTAEAVAEFKRYGPKAMKRVGSG